METLLPLVNKIQEIFSKTNLSNTIQLPQLVVVGAQSTGKSSVLEAIVGKEFLPRGSGIVTRRPVILQLNHTAPDTTEHAELSHKPGQKFYDYNQVRKEIEYETEKIAGMNKGISTSPIIVKIYSPTVVDLNLVDLPGITKIPVGDQPHDIESKIRDMILTYIKNPNTIILAISAANNDIANSDALKLAREVDPEGFRTLGIVTKLDTLDEETDVLDTLQGKLYPLKLGYVGVVCRNQKDLNSKKTVKDSLEAEREFFQKHKAYRLNAERMGVPYLSKILNLLFIQHIKKTMPNMKNKILDLYKIKQGEMLQFGDLGYDENNKESKGMLLLSLLSSYSSAYGNYLRGTFTKKDSLELFGGARINYIIHELFIRKIKELDPFDCVTDEDVRAVIKNSDGFEDPLLFISEKAFDLLIRQQISRLLHPSLQLARQVFEELMKILTEINFPELIRFRTLNDKMVDVMRNLLLQSLKPTEDMIRNLIQIELGHINRNHPDFLENSNFLPEIMNEINNEANKNTDPSKTDKKAAQQLKDPKSQPSEESKAKEHKSKGLFGAKQPSPKFEDDDLESKMASLNGKNVGVPDFKNKVLTVDNPSYYNVLNNTKFPNTILPSVPANLKLTDNISKRERISVQLIKKLIDSYLNVVKKNINDSVPKTIVTFLINKTRDYCERELIIKIYKEDVFESLMSEDPVVAEKRTECKNQLKVLQDCLNVIQEIDSKI